MDNSSSHVESRWRTQLRNRIIQASSLLEILLSGLVLIGLLLSAVPLIKWMPGLLFDGNEVEIRIFLERSLDIVIGIEFIKMLAKHSPGSSLEVLLYAIARHLVVGHDSAVENLLSVGAIALIFIVRKFFFVPAFGAHLPDGHPAPDLSPRQSGIPCRCVSLPPEGARRRPRWPRPFLPKKRLLTSTILSRPPRNQNNINKNAPQHCRKTSRLRGIL